MPLAKIDDLLDWNPDHYIRQPGTAERYVYAGNPELEISRRTYENMRVAGIWGSYAEYQRIRHTPEFERLANAWARTHNEKVSKTMAATSEYSKRFQEFRSKDRDKKAQFLVDCGLRQPNDGWDPGDTPDVRKRGY